MAQIDHDAMVPAVDDLTFRALVDGSPDVSTVSTVDGVYCYASPACERVLGWTPAQMVGQAQEDLAHPGDHEVLRAARLVVATGATATTTYRIRTPTGVHRRVEESARLLDVGGAARVVATLRDVDGRDGSAADGARREAADPLTGAADRLVLGDRLRQGLKRLRRSGSGLTVLYLDLDGFKAVNDSLGHRAGDEVLREVAQRLVLHLRPSDTLCRIGGDEFAIVAEDTDEADAGHLASRLLDVGRLAFGVGSDALMCSLSIGVRTTADPEADADVLIAQADRAMYAAKARGGDGVVVFGPQLVADDLDEQGVERMLRHALQAGEVVVHYQPILALRGMAMVGAEALVRITRPPTGLLHPEAFLRVARHSGLLPLVDARVLDDALAQVGAWQRARASPWVSVNTTGRHLADVRFAAELVDRLDGGELDPTLLVLEVPEDVLSQTSRAVRMSLRWLREQGVRVALDDFGTGVSSLAFLRQGEQDLVKVDPTLVQDVGEDRAARAVLGAVVDVSHAMGMSVVAEGVEAQVQLDVLEELGCDQAQGYLLGAGGPPEAITALAG